MIRYRDYENRTAWLRGRNIALGASDIPVVCGLVSYKTPLDLWKEKTGAIIPRKSVNTSLTGVMRKTIYYTLNKNREGKRRLW